MTFQELKKLIDNLEEEKSDLTDYSVHINEDNKNRWYTYTDIVIDNVDKEIVISYH